MKTVTIMNKQTSHILAANKTNDLFFVDETGRIIYIPKMWCFDFVEEDKEGRSTYAWIGQESVNDWRSRATKEWNTYEAQGWVSFKSLESLREVSESEAKIIDPDLFALLDAINSGEAA